MASSLPEHFTSSSRIAPVPGPKAPFKATAPVIMTGNIYLLLWQRINIKFYELH